MLARPTTMHDAIQALQAHSPSTLRHSIKVAALMLEMRHTVPGATQHDILWSGLLHDIGKIDIHTHTLHAARPLSIEERMDIQTHPERGTHILRNLQTPVSPYVHDAAMFHHEQWGGKGYPSQALGHRIPAIGRMCQVCDIFEALTSNDRAYRSPESIASARASIHKMAGSACDPHMVRQFQAIPEERLRLITRHNKIPHALRTILVHEGIHTDTPVNIPAPKAR